MHSYQPRTGLKRPLINGSAANLQLRREIARRQIAEETLHQKEKQSRLLLKRGQLLQEQLRLLSHRVIQAQEAERKRISRELHDVIAQMLTGINVRLATLKNEAMSNTRGLTKSITQTQRLVEKSADVVRQFACELRPASLSDLGLVPALHTALNRFAKDTGLHVTLKSFNGVEQLDVTRRTVLFRVAQEALSNIAHHARASRVEVNLSQGPGTLSLDIKDDGRSFDVDRMWQARKRQHLGLLGMRERMEMIGGTLTVMSTPGHGTTIRAQIPFTRHGEG